MKKNNNLASESELLLLMNVKLDILIAQNAIIGKSKEDQVKYLASIGYSNSEISTILATPKGTIDSIRAKSNRGK